MSFLLTNSKSDLVVLKYWYANPEIDIYIMA